MRSWRALVGAVAGSLVVLGVVAPPAAAIDAYVLTQVTLNPTVGAPVSFALTTPSTGPAGIPSGYYCLAAQNGQPATSSTVTRLNGEISANLSVTFASPGTYDVVLFEVGPPANIACPGNTLLGTVPLTTKSITVSAVVPTSVAISPATATVAAAAPANMAVVLTGAGGVAATLAANQSVVVDAPTAPTVTFNGAAATSVTILPGQPLAFTAQNSVPGQTATIRAQLRTNGTPFTTGTATLVTSGATYQLAVDPVTATTTIGGKTNFALTLSSAGGASVSNVPVTVSSTGRNTFSGQSAGTTNGAGKLSYSLQDNAPATSLNLTDTVTFTAAGVSVTATVTYRPAASAKVTVVSPSNGSAISSGGLFGVSAVTTGIAPGTIAYLTLGGSAKAQSTVQANGNIRFDNTSIGGGKWIPAEAGQYAVRVCGPTQATSNPFALTIIPFQIIPPAAVKSGKASFTVATGNWAVGTTIYLTRNGNAVKKVQVATKGKQLVITTKAVAGKYQVRVNSNQGYVYGNQAGVVTLK